MDYVPGLRQKDHPEELVMSYTVTPSYVVEGQQVIVKYRKKPVICTVVAAMGRTARVVNESKDIDIWCDVDDLQIEKEDNDA